METITVTEFARHIGEYLERCARGETFRLTRYGQHIAYVEPHPTIREALENRGRDPAQGDAVGQQDGGERAR